MHKCLQTLHLLNIYLHEPLWANMHIQIALHIYPNTPSATFAYIGGGATGSGAAMGDMNLVSGRSPVM